MANQAERLIEAGRAFQTKGQYAAAIEKYERAIQIPPPGLSNAQRTDTLARLAECQEKIGANA